MSTETAGGGRDHDREADARVAAGLVVLGTEDAGELLTLQRAAWLTEAIEGATLAIPPLHESLADVAAQLADASVPVLGVRERGRLVATVRVSRLGPGVAFVARLATAPDLVGAGLGGAMLRLAEARAPEDTVRVELVTGARSTRNHRFYERRGYRRVAGRAPEGAVRFAKERGTTGSVPRDGPVARLS